MKEKITAEEFDKLREVYDSIALQSESIKNAGKLLGDYKELFSNKKDLLEIGADAFAQQYKLLIVWDYIFNAHEEIEKNLKTLNKTLDLYAE